MSRFTQERQLKRENGIKYWIDIQAFNRKMNWRCGNPIYSRMFKISESVFSVHIFPNGNETERGHMGVFLQNESGWIVKCKVTFSVKQHKKTSGNILNIDQDQGWGFARFASHEEMDVKGLLNNDGGLTMEVDVQLLGEEVIASRSVVSRGDDLQSLQIEVCAIKGELESQKREIKYMKSEMCRRMTHMSKALNVIAYKMKNPSLTSCGPTKEIRDPLVPGEGSDPIMERPSLTVTSSCGPTKKIHYPFLQGEGSDPILEWPSLTGPTKEIQGEGPDPIVERPSSGSKIKEMYPFFSGEDAKCPGDKLGVRKEKGTDMWPETTKGKRSDYSLICRPNCVTS